MRGDPKGPKKNLSFKVHWVGEEKPTYETWRNMRKTKALHTFLRNHTKEEVRNLFPKEFESDYDNDSEVESDEEMEG